ncbi:MAG: hypothetical protein QF805_13060, partial [Pirellulaceae bacterium]|nr:hypothetical protein [Pirellulaceae bacterium]
LHSPGRPGLSELVIDSALTVAISHTIASSAIELRQLTVRNVKPSDGCLRILAASRALQRGLSTLDLRAISASLDRWEELRSLSATAC